MYNQSLERLIEVCLADGVLTDKEKEVIRNKAKSLGYSPDEVVIYAEGLLHEKNSTKRSSKEGKAYMCPNCGANLPSMVSHCPDCGHEIRDNQASDSVRLFSTKYLNTKSIEEKAHIVDSFPVPNNKEDLLEFMALAYPQSVKFTKNSKTLQMASFVGIVIIMALVLMLCVTSFWGYFLGALIIICGVPGAISLSYSSKKSSNVLNEAWNAKLKQVSLKASMLQGTDRSFSEKMLEIQKKYDKEKKAPVYKVLVTITIIIGLIVALCLKGAYASSEESKVKDRITLLINSGDYEEANNLQLQILPDKDLNEDKMYEEYYDFLVKCVHKMCENHEYSQARIFVKEHVGFFPEDSWINSFKKHKKESVETELNDIIDSAE